jgi:hypothetical protein
MDDDVIETRMAELRRALAGSDAAAAREAGHDLIYALEAALRVHRPGERVCYASGCYAHPSPGLAPSCPDCEPEARSQICATCRDSGGEPLPFEDCRLRKAVAAELGKSWRQGGGGRR